MAVQVKSPITGSSNVEFVAQYNPSITSDSRIVPYAVDNWICRDSGVIFNASGVRGEEKSFYTDEYDLHSENTLSEFMYFDKGESKGIYDNIIEFIKSKIDLPRSGELLEVGCGKGLLLNRFSKNFPDWKLSAVEPSTNAKQFFLKVMPSVELFEGTFENSPFINKKFDLILANGVLEHVPNPLEFLKILVGSLKDNGMVYIGVPNFATNPSDLFTFDHLTRFTPETIRSVFNLSGMEIVYSLELNSRVPMWFLVKPNKIRSNIHDDKIYSNSKSMAEQSVQFIRETFLAYDHAAEVVQKHREKLAFYGTGTAGLLGLKYTQLKDVKIEAIFDDNNTLWGNKREGILIKDPSEIRNSGIKHFILSANPCYFEQMRTKIRSFAGSNVKIYPD